MPLFQESLIFSLNQIQKYKNFQLFYFKLN